MDINSLPIVSVITVNYNGKTYLKNLFESLNCLDYPKEKIQIIMVDNASADDSVRFTRENFPFVEIIACRSNTGFAEGNNIGIRHAKGELIAIINNDCVADSKWLISMVETLADKEKELKVCGDKECRVGAVGSKIFFYYRYYPLNIYFGADNKKYGSQDIFYGEINKIELKNTNTSDISRIIHKSENNVNNESEDFSLLLQRSIRYLKGVVPAGKNKNGDSVYKLGRESLIAIPVTDNNSGISLKIDFSGLTVGETININIVGKDYFSESIGKDRKTITLDIPGSELPSPEYIINSMGSMLNKKFYAKEIAYEKFDNMYGSTEEDISTIQHIDKITEVFAIPGTGFLCRKSVLDSTGFFDKKFFTYYEDIDFFWRLKLAGYRNYICTDSVLRHFHCGSGKEWSYSFTYHVLRNRLLMIYKCAWFKAFLKNYLSFTANAFISLGYGIIMKIRKRAVSRPDIPIRIKIFFEFFILLFQKMPDRIKTRKNAIITDKEIIKWLKDF